MTQQPAFRIGIRVPYHTTYVTRGLCEKDKPGDMLESGSKESVTKGNVPQG